MNLRKNRTAIGDPVVVFVVEDHERVVHRLERLPFRIGLPRGNPESTLAVDLHLHRIADLGELRFIGKDIHLETVRHGHLRDAFLGGEVSEGALLLRARTLAATTDIRDHRHRGRHIAVVDLRIAALGSRPDLRVAIGGHDVEHGELVLKDLGVALVVDECEGRASTPDIIAVRGAVAVVPVPILVEDGLADRFELGVGRGGILFRKCRGDDLSDVPVSEGVEMDAIDREGLGDFLVELHHRLVEIHERDPFVTGHLLHRSGVKGQPLVVRTAVGEIRIVQILVGDRAEKDDARDLAIGPCLAQIADHASELLLVIRQSLRAGEGLVVAEEGEDYVGLHMTQVIGHLGEALRTGVFSGTIAGMTEISENEVFVRIRHLEPGFGPAVVLHAVGEAIADHRDDITLAEGEGLRIAVAGRDGLGQDRHGQGLAIVTRHRDLRLAREGEGDRPIGSRIVFPGEDRFPLRVEQLDLESLEPLVETAAVPDLHRINRLGRAEVEFPPGCGITALGGMGLALLVEVAVLVAVDGPLRRTARTQRRLRRLSCRGHVLPAALHLHLGQGEDPLFARERNTDETGRGLVGGVGDRSQSQNESEDEKAWVHDRAGRFTQTSRPWQAPD